MAVKAIMRTVTVGKGDELIFYLAFFTKSNRTFLDKGEVYLRIHVLRMANI